MDDDRTWGASFTTWVGLVVLVVIAVVYFSERTIDRHQAKVARVFDLAKEYRLTLRQTNAQFSTRWNEYLNDSVDPYNGGNLDERAYADLVNRFIAADDNHNNYEALAGFYDSIGDCVEAGLCDFWLARAMFGNDVVIFYHNMYPVLESENQQGQSDAGIVEFVNRMHAADRGEIQPDWRDRYSAWAG